MDTCIRRLDGSPDRRDEADLGVKSPIQIIWCLVRGFCTKCGREVGGWFKSPAWQCPRCKGLYCERCPKRTVGRWFKKQVCPECRIELAEVSNIPRSELLNIILWGVDLVML